MASEADASSDLDLLRRALTGDDASFATLMRRHEDKIFSLALRMLGDRSDALDATQEAFISAFRQAHSFRGDSAFGTWLFRIAINSCKDLIRKRKRWVPEGEEALDRADPASAGFEETVAIRLELRDALAELPPEYRDAVVLHDLAGVPYAEIAAIMGTQIGTVKSRISRGRRRLAELLEHHPTDRTSKDKT